MRSHHCWAQRFLALRIEHPPVRIVSKNLFQNYRPCSFEIEKKSSIFVFPEKQSLIDFFPFGTSLRRNRNCFKRGFETVSKE